MSRLFEQKKKKKKKQTQVKTSTSYHHHCKTAFSGPRLELILCTIMKKKEISACKYTTNVECWSQEKDSAWVVHVCMCLCMMTK